MSPVFTARVTLSRSPRFPGDARPSLPPRMFSIVITALDASSSTTHYHPGPIGAAADYARGIIRARTQATTRTQRQEPR